MEYNLIYRLRLYRAGALRIRNRGMQLMRWVEFGCLFVIALITTIALVPLAKKLAVKLDAIDYPDERRVNQTPIPRLGGIAIIGGIAISLFIVWLGSYFFGWRTPFSGHPGLTINYLWTIIGMLFMFGVGLIDDVFDLRALVKLGGQIIAATIVTFSGVLLSSIHNPFGSGFIEFGWLAYPITIFYLVAFANIINLIDGLDGLASGITMISAFTIFVFAVLTNRFDAAIISIAVAGACIGFLRYNFYPASIFMGDSGALFLGFSLGIASLLAVTRAALFVSLLVPILAAGIPIMDTFFAIIRRLRAHESIIAADKGHIHHKLLQAGFSQRKTVLIMWVWTAILALCGIFITEAVGFARIPFFIIILGVTIYVVVKLQLLHPVLIHHYNPRGARKPKSSDGADDRHGDDIG